MKTRRLARFADGTIIEIEYNEVTGMVIRVVISGGNKLIKIKVNRADNTEVRYSANFNGNGNIRELNIPTSANERIEIVERADGRLENVHIGLAEYIEESELNISGRRNNNT